MSLQKLEQTNYCTLECLVSYEKCPSMHTKGPKCVESFTHWNHIES